ncbi:MFS transporter [Arthrobacter sp. ISL-65]|uniref:MFS transporter n=1 Tax=Arthrobacter sp. ISL-65 TaxID=2819112 RepID=UPI001BEA106C|nr:MFS transporter [Arthrobacter sp. ISL-65]MBT2548889.1 MFS transporter [Arthrobacter sp. ISL-65]
MTTSSEAAARLPAGALFVIAAAAFVMVFAAAGAPIPLYDLYRGEDGIATGDLAFGAVGYFAGTLFSLLFLGRLSDHIGRKPVILGSIGFAIAGSLLMSGVHTMPALLVARLLQGLGSGLAASAMGAYVFDTARGKPAWLPAMVTGSGPMLGIPLGALLAALLVETAPLPRALPFLVISAVLAVLGVGFLFGPETCAPTPGARRSLRPQVSVPNGAGRLVFAVGAAFVATWCIGGFYQAFAPTITTDNLGSDSVLVAAAVFSSIMIAAPLGGPIAGKLGPPRAIRAGAIIFTLAVIGALLALWAGAIIPFLISSLLGGIAQGVLASGGTRAILEHTPAHERGATLSTIYVISYSGAAIPALIAGRLTGLITLPQLFLGYTGLVAIAAILAILALDPPRTDRSTP